MPVTFTDTVESSQVITGSLAALGSSADFKPLNLRSFNVTIWGTFVGTVGLQRSFDQGTTWFPMTTAGAARAWTGPASEVGAEPEFGVHYRLTATAYTSGTINYRLSQ